MIYTVYLYSLIIQCVAVLSRVVCSINISGCGQCCVVNQRAVLLYDNIGFLQNLLINAQKHFDVLCGIYFYCLASNSHSFLVILFINCFSTSKIFYILAFIDIVK